MSAANLNLTIEQGATFRRKLTIKDPNGALIDLTGFIFSGQLRPTYDYPDVIASFVFTILDQTLYKGQCEVSLSATVTAAIPVNGASKQARNVTTYIYDMDYKDLGNVVTRFLQGLANVSPEVTR